MTFKEKRKYKRLARTYLIIAYSIVPIPIVSFILLVSRGRGVITDALAMYIVLGLMGLLVSATIFVGLSQMAQIMRSTYLKHIHTQRENIRVNLILDATHDLNLSKALEIYNGFEFHRDLDGMLIGHIATMKLCSADADDVASAKIFFAQYRKIFLNQI